MTKEREPGAVRRKIRAATPEEAGGVGEKAARVWQQAGARALNAAVGMNARVTGVGARLVANDDLPSLQEEGDLVALVENEDGHFGLVLVSGALVASLVEMQTIGRVTDRPFRPRRPTAVDGALVGPAVDRLLAAADVALSAAGLGDPATGYRYAMLAEPGTPPTLSLADVPHRVLTLDFRVEGSVRAGQVCFVTPQLPPSGSTGRDAAEWSRKMERVVLASDLALQARLGRVRMPVDKVLEMRAGDTLPFLPEDLQRVELVAGAGQVVARGRLGQSGGFRAVKLNLAVAGDDPRPTRDTTDGEASEMETAEPATAAPGDG